MTIPRDKLWNQTERKVEVVYDPLFADGGKGRRQTCYLPWEGSLALRQDELVMEVVGYFAEKYGAGQDSVVSARIIGR